jgi:hypothetical protein
VCAEIYAVAEDVAMCPAGLRRRAEEWQARGLRVWGWIAKTKAVIPVILTAFLDGSLILRRVLDPRTLQYDDGGGLIPVAIVSFTILAPPIILLCAGMHALFAALARRRLRAEEEAGEQARSKTEGAAGAEGAETTGGAEATNEGKKGNGKQGKDKGTKGKGTKGKGKGKKGKDDEDDDGPKWWHCSSRGWRITAKFFFWFAVCTFFFVSAFGLFVKVATAVQTLGGQIGVGTRLLLNILDLAYVVVSLVAMVPKMVRPAM